MSKVIAHIDLNAFFASVEQIEQPHLRGKPIAVGGQGRRGIVVTASYEARAFGVKAGMPTYQAKVLCPSLIIVGHHFDAYHRYSEQFKAFMLRHTSMVEMASIDECYADFSHIDFIHIKPQSYFKKLQDELFHTLKLPSSWGIAPTKFLAKMASDMKKPMGITFLRKKDIPKVLYPMPVEAMYGIGKKTYPRLYKRGIRTIGDLMKEDYDEDIRLILGKFYFTIQSWLKGQGHDKVDETQHDPKSIGHSTTLQQDTDDFQVISATLTSLVEDTVKRSQTYHLVPRTLTLTIKRPDFKVISRSITYGEPLTSTQQILPIIKSLFHQHFRGEIIRLIGVSFHQLVQEEKTKEHVSLFDPIEEPKNQAQTQKIMDTINARFKKKIVNRASHVKIVVNK